MIEKAPAAGDLNVVEYRVRASPRDIECLGALVEQLRTDCDRTHREIARSPVSPHGPPVPVSVARLLLLQRRERALAFAECDFGEAVWDVMLHLYIAHYEYREVEAYALASIVGVPQSTAFRWIVRMEERGQLVREPDRADRRRTFVTLTPTLRDRIAVHLERVGKEMIAMFNGRQKWSVDTTALIAAQPSGAG